MQTHLPTDRKCGCADRQSQGGSLKFEVGTYNCVQPPPHWPDIYGYTVVDKLEISFYGRHSCSTTNYKVSDNIFDCDPIMYLGKYFIQNYNRHSLLCPLWLEKF
jgi:hypothetical protein